MEKHPCSGGNHSLVVIHHGHHDGLGRPVARWCHRCGAVVVDSDFDGRRNAGYHLPMTFCSHSKPSTCGHRLREIARITVDAGCNAYASIKWCDVCGRVEVVERFDGRNGRILAGPFDPSGPFVGE